MRKVFSGLTTSVYAFRLELALGQQKSASLILVAKNETKLLDNQKVTLPTTDVASLHQQTNDIDNVSMEIMLKYHPAYTEENIALRTVGDGNCLYRTISKNLTGTEQYL